VTRLPDGRVLKGPRRVQRKKEEFWTDVAQETDALIPEVDTSKVSEQVSEAPDSPAAPPRKSRKQNPAATPKAPRRKSSAVTRARKSGSKESTPKPKSSGPRPSERGYKWPNP
jgi:hypothetical protein